MYRLYAQALGIPFDDIEVHAEGDLDARRLFGIDETVRAGFTAVRLDIRLSGPESRERYEQLARAYRRVADNPSVQGAAGVARAKAGEAVQAGIAVAKDKVAPSAGGALTGSASVAQARHTKLVNPNNRDAPKLHEVCLI